MLMTKNDVANIDLLNKVLLEYLLEFRKIKG